MLIAQWWEREQDRRRQRNRLAEMRMARAAEAELDRLRKTRVESNRGIDHRNYPSVFVGAFSDAGDPDQVAAITERAAKMEADLDRDAAWTWRCVWTEASELATQRIGAKAVGGEKATTLYQVARNRVLSDAVKDRQMVRYAKGIPSQFLVLQSVPAPIAAFLIGASYGRYRELLDEADEWTEGLDD